MPDCIMKVQVLVGTMRVVLAADMAEAIFRSKDHAVCSKDVEFVILVGLPVFFVWHTYRQVD